jgi:hypothetical protein
MIFEFINPSDKYHFEATDLEIGAGVTVILGEGKAAAQCVDDENIKVPFFMFGNTHDAWFKEKFGFDFEASAHRLKNERKQDLINALNSFTIGTLEDYHVFQEAMKLIDDPKKREKYRKVYHKKKLTSLSDFGTYAWAFARELGNSE